MLVFPLILAVTVPIESLHPSRISSHFTVLQIGIKRDENKIKTIYTKLSNVKVEDQFKHILKMNEK